MLTAYVYYKLTGAMQGLHHGDVLKQVGSQTFSKVTTSDAEICGSVFDGCNSGSSNEYPWFAADSALRSMSSGDVVTIVRGGLYATSYLCESAGWLKLSVPVLQPGVYIDPLAPPQLWQDNQAFIRSAERALNAYSKITVAIHALIAMSDKEFQILRPSMFPDLVERLRGYLDSMVLEQVCSSTPFALTSILRNSRDSLINAARAQDEDMFLLALADSRQLLNKVLEFTRKRLAESRQPSLEPIPA